MTVGDGKLLCKTSVLYLRFSRRLDASYHFGFFLLRSPHPLDPVAPSVRKSVLETVYNIFKHGWALTSVLTTGLRWQNSSPFFVFAFHSNVVLSKRPCKLLGIWLNSIDRIILGLNFRPYITPFSPAFICDLRWFNYKHARQFGISEIKYKPDVDICY
jgi:hypothetical protein